MSTNSVFNIKKGREIWVLAFVGILAICSIVFSNYLANKIEKQEEIQVIIWAKAITEKARVLKMSNAIFEDLAKEERKKMEITTKATDLLVTDNDQNRLSFYLDIAKLNDQMPVVITDQNGKIQTQRNVLDKSIQTGNYLSKSKHIEFYKYPPIEIELLGRKNYIYYKDSKIYERLRKVIDQSSSQFVDEITNNASSLPVILMDKDSNIVQSGNLPKEIQKDSIKTQEYIHKLKQKRAPIVVDIDGENKLNLYYENSSTALYIKWFPIALYSTLAILLFLTIAAMRSSRNFEKNQIWVGMSKETAHQLGTPINSLTAWLEVFDETKDLPESKREVITEMKKDVKRLSLIADRFSKIGSKPKLESANLAEILQGSYGYLKARASKKIHFELDPVNDQIFIDVNRQLFEWVIENLVKNAFDAIPQEGSVTIVSKCESSKVIIDIIDTGKGILPQDVETIFEPGFTTKKRGWGLGLSLCKRIIDEYFGGKIYVLGSKINHGTTIRIELRANFNS